MTLLLLITGFFLSTYLLPTATVAERLSYVLLLFLIPVPFVAINTALIGTVYIDKPLLLYICVAFLLVLSVHLYRYLRDVKFSARDLDLGELAILAGALPVALFFYHYYSNLEVYWSLGSYLQTGKSSCFTMQTYKLVEQLNMNTDRSHIRQIYSIISTPGNVMFSGGMMPLFGIHTFHYLYLLFQLNLYLFSCLLMYRWCGRAWIAIIVGLLVVLNPYSLSVEILDRNLMALSLCASLLYTVYNHRREYLLHGLLFGITAGAGLRFLPLTYGLPILIIYLSRKTGLRGYLLLLSGFVLTFSFNIPHLFFHGFHSLGHSEPFWSQLATALSRGSRTPLMPFPNFVFYAVNTLNYLGYALAALVLFGAGKMLIQKRLRFLQLLLISLPTYVVLGAQPDWIEIDKARILLTALLPLVLFAGHGLASLQQSPRLLRDGAVLALLPLVVAGIVLLLGQVAGQPDMTLYQRKQVYQKEAGGYTAHARRQLSRVGALPNYWRLMNKTDLARKRVEGRMARATLLARQVVSRNSWVARWMPATKRKQVQNPAGGYVNILVDLERLVSSPAAAVKVVEGCDPCFVDFENKKDLLDIYYRAVKVSWQQQKLPVVVLPGKPEQTSLGELNLELNAFIGYGKDEYGFERVNLINLMTTARGRAHAKKTGMTALPQRGKGTAITLRIPRTLKLIVRNWIVEQEQGVPHRIDSWRITVVDRRAHLEFFFQEPESYF